MKGAETMPGTVKEVRLGISALAYVSMAIAFGVDWMSLQRLARPTQGGIGEVAVLHGIALVFGWMAFWGMASAHYRRARWTMAAWFAGLAISLPVVGMALVFLLRWAAGRVGKSAPEDRYFFGDRQVLTEVNELAQTHYQSVLQILKGTQSELRRRAIIALRVVDPKRALPVLQKAIQDSDEQVRLLAQTQFGKILAGLEAEIKRMESVLAKGPRSARRLFQLAEQYHELVFLGVSSEETEAVYLGRATELLNEALAEKPEDLSARFLLLKCHVKQRNCAAARSGLEMLKAGGFKEPFLRMWEAEIAFLERDWGWLRRTLMEMNASKETDPRLRGFLGFWLNSVKTDKFGPE